VKVAAIDIGANSVHLVVCRLYAPGVREVLDRSREMLRLGEATFRTGGIPADEMKQAIGVLKRYRAIAEAHGVEAVLAVATSSVREAENRDEFVRRAQRDARLVVRVLSGEEEGRLIYTGVRDAMPPSLRRTAVIDIGGGSCEVVLGDGPEVREAWCLPLGGLRLAVEHPGRRPKDFRALEEHIRETLKPVTRDVARFGAEAAVGTSGTILTLADLLKVRDDARPIRFGPLEELVRRLVKTPPKGLREIPQIGAKRADSIVPGALVVKVFMEEAGRDEIQVCERALREGVVTDYALRNAKRLEMHEGEIADPRRRSVHFLARRLGTLDLHARQTARLALRLFDALAALHGLGQRDRELLEYGALLHDAGYWIAAEKHHRHAYYLIRKAELEGFDREEIRLLALLARYHRGAEPRASHEGVRGLRKKERRRLKALAALLRIADGLDRSHAGLVKDIGVSVGNGRVTVELSSTGEAELELYAAEDRSGLFRKVFERDLKFRLKGTGRS
jgi:exopolyphosphatase/guanosine-5'-triphosphate,3'-diphosphate pyrophosphatase